MIVWYMQFLLIYLPILVAIRHLHNCGCDIIVLNLNVPGVAKHCSQLDRDVIWPSDRCNLQFATLAKSLEVSAFLLPPVCAVVRFTLHAGTQTIGNTAVFARKPCVRARKHSMDSHCKSSSATSFRFRTCLRLWCLLRLIYSLRDTRIHV